MTPLLMTRRHPRPTVVLMLTAILLILNSPASASGPHHYQHWDPFLDTLQHRTIKWFLDVMPPTNGLTPDRWPSTSHCSIAAVGFALTVYPIAAERGVISRKESARRVLLTLRFLLNAPQGPQRDGIAGYRGLFYHFLALKDGTRAWNCELSTIDTGLLMAGVLFCQSYYPGNSRTEKGIRQTADSLYRRVDWTWSTTGRPGIMLGWTPEKESEGESWHGYNEAMILYILALGSPTHTVAPEVWDSWTSTYVWATYYGQEFISFGPLFGHQFSHCWIDFRGIRDRYMRTKGIDYFENSRRATYSQRSYGAENPLGYKGYSEDVWGITPCDGPGDTTFLVDGKKRTFIGYAGRGVSFDWALDDGTIAPTGAGSSVAFAPEVSISCLKAIRMIHGRRIFRKYGFIDAFNPTFVTNATGPEGWYDRDYLGIDQGPIVLMIENLRNGFVWKVMRKNPYIRQGLTRAGFTGGWLGD